MDFKEKARRIKREIPAVFLALKHPKTPLPAKILAGITVGYALSPVDLIPDLIPVLGYLDDVLLLPALLVCTIRMIPKDILEECRTEAEGMWQNGKPKKWYYALPIVLIWLVISWVIVRKV